MKQPDTSHTMNTKPTESTHASANTAVIAKTEGTAINRKFPMKATQEDYLKLPENVRLIISQISSYMMGCTNPARMFFHRSEICTAVTCRGALVDTALRMMLRHCMIEVVRSHSGGPVYCQPVRLEGILTQEAHDRCLSHWLAVGECRHWPRFVVALTDGPRSLSQVSEVIYLSPVPQSPAVALLVWAGVITCAWTPEFTSGRWAETAICQLRREALA